MHDKYHSDMKKPIRKNIWKKLVLFCACVVVFCTIYALILPAVTLEKKNVEEVLNGTEDGSESREMICSMETMEIHTHNDRCYDDDGNLTCGYADFVVHIHRDDCYDTENQLVCSLPEIEVHEHNDQCYEEVPELVCGQEETESHTHDESCYEVQKILICEEEEIVLHTHGDSCYDENGKWICGRLEITEHIHGDACFAVVDKKDGWRLEAQTDSAIITAACEEGVLPEGISLVVSEYKEESETFDEIGQMVNDNLTDHKVLQNIYPFDIHFEDEDGQNMEPEGTVTVTVTFKEPVGEDGENVSEWLAFHITASDIEELTGASVIREEADGIEEVTGFTFQSEMFSDFVLAETGQMMAVDETDSHEDEDDDIGTDNLDDKNENNESEKTSFLFWRHLWDKNEKKYVSISDSDDDKNKINVETDEEETFYLIPVSYFVQYYGDKGYVFDEKHTDECPFFYAPDAYHKEDNLTKAVYVHKEGEWYVRVQDIHGGDYTYKPNIPRCNLYYRNYGIVTETNTHSGTIVNLFDYWVTEKEAFDGNGSDELNGGINNGHALKFRYNYPSDKDILNKWTGADDRGNAMNVLQGIVANTLTNGYPVLSGSNSLGLTNEIFPGIPLTESLAYLFDPTLKNDYKEIHRNVGGLLQVDKDGYYYYSSEKNFAEYNEKTNRFILYDEPGVYPNGGGSGNKFGQFFPFNSMKEVNSLLSTNAAINHYLGMTLSTRFIQKYDGHTNNSKKTETVFEFAGDDDVWIFIDGVLVADLGGIHNAASVQINFSTGEVKINNGSNQSTTLRAAFEKAGAADKVEWNDDGTIFKNNTTHTLKFFYLERGNTDSNLLLKYNLTEIPATSIYKVDQYGMVVPGAAFAVYAAKKQSDDEWLYLLDDSDRYIDLDEISYTVDEDTGVISIEEGIYKGKTITPRYIDTTDEKGEMIFLDEDKVPYSLSELQEKFGGKYFILREVSVPAGYRLVSKEIYLYIENNVLLCHNTYTAGVCAVPTVLVTATNTLHLYEPYNSSDKVEYFDPDQEKGKGTLFAVVFKYIGKRSFSAQENWIPVYGDDMHGYHTVEPSGDSVNEMKQAVITAAKEAKKYGDVTFSFAASGMQVELTNLPGDILKYYYMLDKEDRETKTQYTIGYYWTPGTLEDAVSSNIYRVDADEIIDENETILSYGFDRTFGATINVPNLINRMFAQKKDENGELINGASFALYKVEEDNENEIYYVADDKTKIVLKSDADNDNAGTAIVKGNAKEYQYRISEKTGVIKITDGDTELYKISPARNANREQLLGITTDSKHSDAKEDGSCSFSNLLDGCYYLREISAPKGYEINHTEVMVLVTEDAIYANAGTEDDGVIVGRGPGYIVSTLDQFASKGQIDNTLSWVYERMRISGESTSFQAFENYEEWGYLKENDSSEFAGDGDEPLTTYLFYDTSESANTLFNYTINQDRYPSDTDFSKITRRMYTTVGWSYYELYQDYDYGSKKAAENEAAYEDLRETGDIANLFSRSLYVQVTDKAATDVWIKKVDMNKRETTLSGAKFRLYYIETNAADETKVPVNVKYYYAVDEQGKVRWETDEKKAVIVTTDKDGLARLTNLSGNDTNTGEINLPTFMNLSDGIYYLEETDAPTGYHLLTEPVILKIYRGEVTVMHRENSSAGSMADSGMFDEETNKYVYTVTVPNSSGYVLPDTGGKGTQMYIWAGMLLMAGSMILLLHQLKKVHDKKQNF